MMNDDKLLSQFIHNHNLDQNSNHHKCHCGSPMVDSTRKKTLKDDTIKIYQTILCANRLCRNQLSVRKNTFLSFTDSLGRPNCKLDVRTIMEMIWFWCLETPSTTIATLIHVSEPAVVDWTNFLGEVSLFETIYHVFLHNRM